MTLFRDLLSGNAMPEQYVGVALVLLVIFLIPANVRAQREQSRFKD